MAAVTIRKLPDDVHAVLKRRAKANGHSTEAEIRATLINATLPPPEKRGLGLELHEIWKSSGAPPLIVPPRQDAARALDFSGPEFGLDDT